MAGASASIIIVL